MIGILAKPLPISHFALNFFKIFSACQESQAAFLDVHVRASPQADREKVGFLGLAVLLVFGQPQVYDGVQILTIAIGVHDEVS